MGQTEHLIKIFEYALSQEYTGKSFFENSLQRMGIGAAVTAFKSLIKEEEKHIRLITRILKGLRGKGEMEWPDRRISPWRGPTISTSGPNPNFWSSV